MSKEYKFEGKSVQSAIESGLTQLGLRRDQVEVAVITEGSSGFLGLGAKPAIIKITERLWNTGETTRQETEQPRQPRDKRGNQSDRNKNKAVNNVQKAANNNNSKPAENKTGKNTDNRHNKPAENKVGKQEQIKRRSAQVRAVQVPLKARTESTGTCVCQTSAVQANAQELTSAPVQPSELITPAETASAENTKTASIIPEARETVPAEPTTQEPKETQFQAVPEPTVSVEEMPESDLEAVQPEHLAAPALEEGVCSCHDETEDEPETPPEPQAEKIPLPAKHEAAAKLACEVTGELLCKMGIKATGFETGWDAVQERVLISFDTDSSAIIIGKDGQTLASLQYTVTLIVTRKTGDTVNIALDTGNYWKKQDDKIIGEVKRGMNVVRSRGGVYRLPAMDSAHRRFVHKMLENNPDVETYSEGEDRWRKVVLRPRKK